METLPPPFATIPAAAVTTSAETVATVPVTPVRRTNDATLTATNGESRVVCQPLVAAYASRGASGA